MFETNFPLKFGKNVGKIAKLSRVFDATLLLLTCVIDIYV